MSTPAYAPDGKTLLGHVIDGAFSPVPTGDELDRLVHQCCSTIETYFTARKKLSPEFQPRDGVHSTTLMQGQQSWTSRDHHGIRGLIQNGTLRDDNELTTALRKMMTDIDYKIAMQRLDKDWMFDNDALTILGSYFGVEGAPRTREELWAQREEKRRADARLETERDIERKRQQAEYAQSPEGRAAVKKITNFWFKREQLDIVLNALFAYEHLDYADPENPTAEERAANRPKRLANEDVSDNRDFWVNKGLRNIVERSNLAAHAIVRAFKDAEKEYEELWEEIEDKIEITKDECIMNNLERVANQSLEGGPARLTGSLIVPVIDGVTRFCSGEFANLRDLAEAVKPYLDRGDIMCERRDHAGQLVLTMVPPEMLEQWDEHVAEWEVAVGRS